MTRRDAQTSARTLEQVIAAISEGLVALLEEFYGRAPTRMKSCYEDDLVMCVHTGGFSRAEQTLLDGGHGPTVIQQRIEIQQRKRDRFEAVIERDRPPRDCLHER